MRTVERLIRANDYEVQQLQRCTLWPQSHNSIVLFLPIPILVLQLLSKMGDSPGYQYRWDRFGCALSDLGFGTQLVREFVFPDLCGFASRLKQQQGGVSGVHPYQKIVRRVPGMVLVWASWYTTAPGTVREPAWIKATYDSLHFGQHCPILEHPPKASDAVGTGCFTLV